jgi:PhzF family phenazine biosynthesis protein
VDAGRAGVSRRSEASLGRHRHNHAANRSQHEAASRGLRSHSQNAGVDADDGATVYSRMFAPVLGIPEDPGTGSASGPLGAYLLKYKAVSAKIASWLVSLQGVRMGRPSRIHVALSIRAGVLESCRPSGQTACGYGRRRPRRRRVLRRWARGGHRA